MGQQVGVGDAVVVVDGGATDRVAQARVVAQIGPTGTAERHEELGVVGLDGGRPAGRIQIGERGTLGG